ncbi:MAG: hypothetical protein Q8N17_17720, partial [Burkholderiaceae bacterium]|nr:hypothetical protein [Burkholderiaceae bacterium]
MVEVDAQRMALSEQTMQDTHLVKDSDALVAPAKSTLLGERLLASGKLTARDLERALQAQQEMGNLLGKVCVQLGLVSELDVVKTLAEQLSVPFISADSFPAVPLEVPGLMPEFQ